MTKILGKAQCHRCNAESVHDDFKIAMERLDHSIGKHNGRPCPNDGTNVITWNGLVVIHGLGMTPVEPKSVKVKIVSDEQIRETLKKPKNDKTPSGKAKSSR